MGRIYKKLPDEAIEQHRLITELVKKGGIITLEPDFSNIGTYAVNPDPNDLQERTAHAVGFYNFRDEARAEFLTKNLAVVSVKHRFDAEASIEATQADDTDLIVKMYRRIPSWAPKFWAEKKKPKCLILGCGSLWSNRNFYTGPDEEYFFNGYTGGRFCRVAEPWMARILHAAGFDVTGIDTFPQGAIEEFKSFTPKELLNQSVAEASFDFAWFADEFDVSENEVFART